MTERVANSRQHRALATILSIVFATAMIGAMTVNAIGEETAPTRITDPFRAEHEALRQHLRHMTTMVGTLAALTPEEQKETMTHIVMCMGTNIQDHNKWEEEFLFPQIDKYSGTAGDASPLTATACNEHHIIGRWVSELKSLASAPEPDIKAFARRADNLLGLVMAHFETEEEILLPVLDAKMSADEFQKQVADKIVPSTH
jgi:iron-sulfur cluster repair protein YtfE (RIC family)